MAGVSKPCAQCSKVKRCTMYLETIEVADKVTYPAGKTTTTYLCGPCARYLGFAK